MDGIVMAGGKGTRMRPLTNTTPKPLLEVRGKPILEWSLLSLRPSVDRVLVVVKYLKERIADFMAQQTVFEHYELVEQVPEPLGTGHAVQLCQPHLHSDGFLVVNGDDLYNAHDLGRLAAAPLGILALERDDPSRYAAVITDDDGKLVRLHEKPPVGTYPPPVLVNIGAYKFNRSIFDYTLPRSPRGEYEITDYIAYLAQTAAVEVIDTDFWQSIGTPEDLADAQQVDLQGRIFGDTSS